MKLTTYICCGILILFGIFASVYALSGFNALLFVCAYNPVVYRSILSLTGVSALWLLFFLIAFRPTKYVS